MAKPIPLTKKAFKLIEQLDTTAMHVVANTVEYAAKKNINARKALELSVTDHARAKLRLERYISKLENKPTKLIGGPIYTEAKPCMCDSCVDGRDIAKGC